MCGESAEWKDARGIPRWSERSRDFWNRKYARADAATAKMTAFDAATAKTQTPGFRVERETAYRDEYGDDLQNEYDAALNEIKEGFIRGGIYNQSDYDLQKGALDAKFPTGQARLDALASAYVDKTKSDVSSERSKLFWTVNSLKDLEGGLPAIQNTTWDLTSPQAQPFGYWKDGVWKEEAPEFLSDFEKLYLNAATPVVRTGLTTQSASPTRSAKRPTITDSMGVRTPYSRQSQTVIG